MNNVNILGALLGVTLRLLASTKDKQPEVYPVEEDVVLKDVA